MTLEVRVVVPSDIGDTIKLGAREPNKYDVDVSALNLPAQKEITKFALEEKILKVQLGSDAEHSVDLDPILPRIAADVFLKEVKRADNKIQFVVGAKDTTDGDTTLEIDVADLLPVKTDGSTTQGTGVAGSEIAVRISAEEGQQISVKDDGLYVPPAPKPTVTLFNATGTTKLGLIFPPE